LNLLPQYFDSYTYCYNIKSVITLLQTESCNTPKNTFHARFVVFMVMRIQVVVFWVVMLSSDMVGYQHFRGPSRTFCLHLQGEDGGRCQRWCHNAKDHDL